MFMQAEGERAKCGVESPGLSVSASRRIYFIRHGVTEWNKLLNFPTSIIDKKQDLNLEKYI